MIDGWTAVQSAAGLVGALVAVTSTVSSLRASGSRKHVARARDAAALLRDLDALTPGESAGARLKIGDDDRDLRAELSRVLRENAAAFALQNPTPVGTDVLRMLVPLYGVLFVGLMVATVPTIASAGSPGERAALGVTSVVLLCASLFFAVATVVLWWRMTRRNASRALAGTPGKETYLVTPGEIAAFYRSHRARRRTNRAGQRT